VLALRERLGFLIASGAGLLEPVHLRRDLLLFLRELLGLTLHGLHVAIAAAALVPFELLLRLAQPRQRFVRLRAAVARSVRRRAAASRTGWPACRAPARRDRPGPRPSSSARRRLLHRRRSASTPAARTALRPAAAA